MHPHTLDALYSTSLPERLLLARRLFAAHGERLLGLAILQRHLQAIHFLQKEVSRCMAESGMPEHCRSCAMTSATGGCCSRFMADENDAVLLLLNLLSGCPVEVQRDDGIECLFLAATGCTLLFKPFFCLNYLCRQLRQKMGQAELRELDRASGRLLQEQFATEQFLLGIWEEFFNEAAGKDSLPRNCLK